MTTPGGGGGAGGGGGGGDRGSNVMGGMSGNAQHPFSRLPTPGVAGYNLAWSPFYPDKLAVAGAANYGLVGNGRLNIVGAIEQRSGPPLLQLQKGFDTQDGLYDVAWSENHENQIVTASGDGSIKLWDITLMDHPIRNWHEHSREVFSLDWNNVRKDIFASSSWDASVRIWHPERPTCLTAITSHTACVYGCAWSPHNGDLLATACGDGHLRLYDTRSNVLSGGAGPGQAATQAPVATLPVGGEVLSLDWNKYRPMNIATGSTDRAVKIWDLRGAGNKGGATMMSRPPGENVAIMLGHEYAVRKVAWSPNKAHYLASASYDMTARVWNTDAGEMMAAGPRVGAATKGASMTRLHDAHSEFVVGLAWSLFQEGLIASCSWDCETHLWPVPEATQMAPH